MGFWDYAGTWLAAIIAMNIAFILALRQARSEWRKIVREAVSEEIGKMSLERFVDDFRSYHGTKVRVNTRAPGLPSVTLIAGDREITLYATEDA